MSAHKSRVTPASSASPASASRRDALKKSAAIGAAAAVGSLGFPAIVKAQADTIRIGHLTPRTGFLGQLGQYGLRATTLAIDEVNAVRKHLSRIKGGRLAQHAYPARLASIAISDVPGDDPAVIGNSFLVPLN